jgi:hypothetical protein
MIEIGKMGNSGRAAMQRILKEMEAATGDSADLVRCITEEDTPSGTWWRYEPAPHHPAEAITAMIHRECPGHPPWWAAVRGVRRAFDQTG